MLKNKEFIYECNEFKIIYPDKLLRNEIIEKIKTFIDDEGNLNVDNEELKMYLLITLVVSEDEDYQFISMNLDDIREIEENPSFEYETILFYLGNVISDLVISIYRQEIMKIRQTEIELLQSESLQAVEDLVKDINLLAKIDKRVDNERNVTNIRHERGLIDLQEKNEKEVERLQNLDEDIAELQDLLESKSNQE